MSSFNQSNEYIRVGKIATFTFLCFIRKSKQRPSFIQIPEKNDFDFHLLMVHIRFRPDLHLFLLHLRLRPSILQLLDCFIRFSYRFRNQIETQNHCSFIPASYSFFYNKFQMHTILSFDQTFTYFCFIFSDFSDTYNFILVISQLHCSLIEKIIRVYFLIYPDIRESEVRKVLKATIFSTTNFKNTKSKFRSQKSENRDQKLTFKVFSLLFIT